MNELDKFIAEVKKRLAPGALRLPDEAWGDADRLLAIVERQKKTLDMLSKFETQDAFGKNYGRKDTNCNYPEAESIERCFSDCNRLAKGEAL